MNEIQQIVKGNIFVTGCQRSGTRFISQVFSKETGKEYVDERDYGVHDLDALNKFISKRKEYVFHCPSLSSYLEFMVKNNLIKEEDGVIWVIREKEDVYASMKRINWAGKLTEEAKYFNYFGKEDMRDIWEEKNMAWNIHQRDFLENNDIEILEVNYEDYKWHELWKEPGERR